MSYLFSASDDGMSNHLGIATSLARPPTASYDSCKRKETKNEFIHYFITTPHKVLFSHFVKNTDGQRIVKEVASGSVSFYKRELLLLYMLLCLEN